MKRFALLALPCAVLGAPAFAEPATSGVRDNGFSYDYFQLGYQNRDFDGPGDFESDGIDAQLSHALDEHLYIRGEFQIFDYDYDVGPFSDDGDGWLLAGGLGFHTPLVERLDLALSGDIVHVDTDNGDDTGFRLRGGVRHATTDQLELGGGAFFQDVDGLADSEFGIFGNAIFNINKDVGVGAELALGDDSDVFDLFVRINY